MLNEIIYIAGADCYYIARESGDTVNLILGEDPTSKFERLWQMQMYIQNADGWGGGADIFSKFGLNINKQTNVVVARRTFNKYVPSNIAERPREGDLVYIPVLQKLFEIKLVNKEKQFYTHGKVLPYYWELQLEMFKYSHENFNTGLPEFDDIEREHAYVIDLRVTGGNTNFRIDEVVYQGGDLVTSSSSAQVKSWDSPNNIVSIYNIKGEFENGVQIVGLQSGATWNVADYDDLRDSEDFRYYQNADLQAASNVFIDTSETNPFGMS